MHKRKTLNPRIQTLEDLAYIDTNGQHLELKIVGRKEKQAYVGHPFNQNLLKELNIALLAESWATCQILNGLDIRTFLPNLYDKKRGSGIDDRTKRVRVLDSLALVESIHVKVQRRFSNCCAGKPIGYSAASIERRGSEAARIHFGVSGRDGFNRFMRTEKCKYAIDAIPGLDNRSYIEIELAKIRSLLVAIAKCQELIMWDEQVRIEEPKRTRGRPPRGDKSRTKPLVQLKVRISKIDFKDGDELFWIAEQGGINPARLWRNLEAFEDVLDVSVILGKSCRGLKPTKEDVALFQELAMPFFLGHRLPETENEGKICDMLGRHLLAWENTAKRLNQPFLG